MRNIQLIKWFLFLILISCSDTEEALIIPSGRNASIEVTSFLCISNGCLEKDPLSNVLIRLYENLEDLEDNINPIAQNQTNIDGIVRFNNIEFPCVYLSANRMTTTITNKVSVPVNTISYAEFNFFE